MIGCKYVTNLGPTFFNSLTWVLLLAPHRTLEHPLPVVITFAAHWNHLTLFSSSGCWLLLLNYKVVEPGMDMVQSSQMTAMYSCEPPSCYRSAQRKTAFGQS